MKLLTFDEKRNYLPHFDESARTTPAYCAACGLPYTHWISHRQPLRLLPHDAKGIAHRPLRVTHDTAASTLYPLHEREPTGGQLLTRDSGAYPSAPGALQGCPGCFLSPFPPCFLLPPSWTMPLAGDFRGLCGVACVRGLLAQPSLPLPAQRQDCHFVRDASNCSNPFSTECLGAIFSGQLDLFIFNSCKGICHDESFFP